MKKLIVMLAAVPFLAVAQAQQKPPPPPQQGQSAPAPKPGDGERAARDQARAERDKLRAERHAEREKRFAERAEKREQRARLARTLGLAEILDLDEARALKLREQLTRFDERRERARQQLQESQETLRRAADGDENGNGKPVSAAEVDQAIQRMFAARAELEAIDRDTLAALGKDLPAEKRARAAIFLQRFSSRFGPMESRRIERRFGDGEGPFGFDMGPDGMRMRLPGVDMHSFSFGGPGGMICVNGDCKELPAMPDLDLQIGDLDVEGEEL